MKKLSLTGPALTGTQGIFAQKRKGKSYTAQTQAEDFLEASRQIGVVDPTGAWWGLRSSADGKSAGYPVHIFGGEHADAPLEVNAGPIIAEAMVNEGFSAVLDLSMLDPEDWPVVAGGFLDTLFKLNRKPMHVFVDEVDEFAPQTTEDRAQQKCRRIVNRLVRRGGKNGTGVTVITQRTALIDKSVLYSCDTVVALQMNGAGDLKSLRDWLVNHTSKEKTDEIIHSLGKLPRGQAWVMSPGTETFELVHVRPKRTFDSGRTVEEGEVLDAPKSLAPVDLKRLGKAIAASIDHAKANDPVALRARVRELEAQLAGKLPAEALRIKIREVPVLDTESLAALRAGIESLSAHTAELDLVRDRLAQAQQVVVSEADSLRRFAQQLAPSPGAIEQSRSKGDPLHHAFVSHPPTTEPKPKPPAKRKVAVITGKHVISVPADSKAAETLPRATVDTQDVLDAIATLESVEVPATVQSVAAWLRCHPKTKTLLTKIGQLRTDGLLDGLKLTGNGRAIARIQNAQFVNAEFRRNLSEPQQAIVDTITTLEAKKQTVTHVALAAWLGVHPKTKSLLEDLGRLRDRGYLDGLALTDIGRRAAWRRELSVESMLAALDDGPRGIAEVVVKHGGYGTIGELAEDLDVHPKTKSLLEGLGKLRDRGLLTKGWPVRPTDVFAGGAS